MFGYPPVPTHLGAKGPEHRSIDAAAESTQAGTAFAADPYTVSDFSGTQSPGRVF